MYFIRILITFWVQANSGDVVPIAAVKSVSVSSGAVPVAAIANDARLVVNRDLVVV